MNDNNVLVRTLPDSVTEKDELGSHQKIADIISELIDTEGDGKAIALTGTWGSGKSSVIEMIRKNLNNATSLFVFDAWAHERDPLRRSFLENLIDHLSPDWIKEGKWNNFKDELAKRRETTKVTNYSEFTWFGILLSITVVLIPIGFAILNQTSWDKINWLLVIGLVLSSSPLLLGIGKLILDWKKLKNPNSRKRVFALLTGESTKKYRSDTYRTPDPTSIEFHEAYKGILSEALNYNNRKIIIVIDNLDRLDTVNALAMWATMKTFLDFSAFQNADWSKRLWLIVPFDPQAMKRLWDKNGIDKKEHGDLASSFIKKTFQLSFHVPLPILSNWMKYFKENLHRALPALEDEDDVHNVYRIFRLKKFKGVDVPTPREIKIFINRLGTIYRIWHNQIPLNHLALYTAIESDGHIDIDKLQTGDSSLTDPISSELIGIDYQESLAAIYFNVPKEQALHILLGPKLEEAITSRNERQFEEMSSGIGFYKVLEETVEDNSNDWAKESPDLIAWLTNRLAEFGKGAERSLNRSWRLLGESARSIQSWKILNEDIGIGIAKLTQYKQSEEFSKSILVSISKTEIPKDKESTDIDKTKVNDWLSGCLVVLEQVSSLHGHEFIDKHFKCPGDATTYYEIVKAAANMPDAPGVLSKLNPQADPAKICQIINKLVTDGKYDINTHNVVSLLRRINAEWNWEGFLQSLLTRIKAPNDLESAELGELLSTLIEFSDDSKDAQEAVGTVAANGDCFHHLHKALTSKDSDATSLCLFIILKYNPTATVPAHIGNSPTGVQHYTNIKNNVDQIDFAIEDLTGLFIDNNNIDMLFNELKKDKTLKKIRYSIINHLCGDKNLTDLIDVSTFVSNEADFYFALDDEKYQSVVDQYIEQSELTKKIKELPFKPMLASLYGAIIESSKSDTNDIQSFILDGLQNLQKDDWVKEFEAGYYNLFDLLIVLNKSGIKAELKTLYREALNEYKKLVIAGTEPKAKLSEDWVIFVNSLEDNLRKSYIDQIIDEVIEAGEEAGTIIKLFGQSLMECERLVGKKDGLVNKAFYKFFDQKRIPELNWFCEIVESCPDIVEKCKKEYRVSLTDYVETKLKDEQLEVEIRDVLKRVGGKLGIDTKRDEQQDVDGAN